MKKILVVVDYQNDFVNGALGFAGAEKLDAGIAKKVYEYGKGNVFYTLDTHSSEYLSTREGKNLPVAHCIENTTGWQVFGKTSDALAAVEAIKLCKKSFGLDFATEVNGKLPQKVDEIELVGLVSNICVISNAVVFQSHYPNANVTVDASLTASFDSDLNTKSLDVMEGLQIKVINR